MRSEAVSFSKRNANLAYGVPSELLRDATSPPPPPQRRRSVTHAQLMHDKGRTLQDFKRRVWLQELLDEVHTAEIRQLPLGTPPAPAGDRFPPLSKRPAIGKNFAPQREAAEPPQETDKTLGDGKRRKKGRSGKRKDGGERKRRPRSAAGR
ncbi:parathyroid hormone-like hormone a isoform X3 [Phyllopteryx taeniolatus]|uniref:parathyroid hormone-like hormone a isoform X3 n=1 Tax=Phyllopteryx taeniolatus TaxID=161469 RepID=UPI002AD31B13|nr:parathyroid hormone-like hormone a isoform X3 [Phyllopteryx taeniolatus]